MSSTPKQLQRSRERMARSALERGSFATFLHQIQPLFSGHTTCHAVFPAARDAHAVTAESAQNARATHHREMMAAVTALHRIGDGLPVNDDKARRFTNGIAL